jgi:aminoglycoside phosphotransferase family enzyme/predicted kinase
MSHDRIDPDLVRALSRPFAYPHDPTAARGVVLVQTHLSWVFLTESHVYKLRKDVDLGFVRFLSRSERDADCAREIRLNRRLSPDVYLGIASVRRVAGGYEVGRVREDAEFEEGNTVAEHCVVMRRLPDGRDALSLLDAGRLRGRQLDRAAETVARFHERHRVAPGADRLEGWLASVVMPVEDNFRALSPFAGKVVSRSALLRARDRARSFHERNRGPIETRASRGRVVDGHGDLHLAHVWFEQDDSAPLIIDCLEFSEELRTIDAANDVAFLAMDLRYRRRTSLAERFLRTYAREVDDFDLYCVVDYFMSYRAAVRAKVAALVAADERLDTEQRSGAAGSARRHLDMAGRLLAPDLRGALVLASGIVGTGKSTLAEVAADELRGVVISSDRVRKRLAGLPPSARTGDALDRGLYSRERTDETYAGLLERAAPVVDSGRVAVLDATFSEASKRSRTHDWARKREIPVVLVEVRCTEREVLRRLSRREVTGADASDAGPTFYRTSARRFEPTDEWPREDHVVVRTDERGWRGRARRALRERMKKRV